MIEYRSTFILGRREYIIPLTKYITRECAALHGVYEPQNISVAFERAYIYSPCSAELISTAYQPWNSVFLSQQISHSRLISKKNSLPNRATADGSVYHCSISFPEKKLLARPF
jgi:hypothetical protein